MEHESFCARCARHVRNCCQVPDIYVTPADMERIAAHTGRHDFYELRVSADPVYLEQDDDPAWREFVIREDGSRRILRHTESGDCLFLEPHGCTLPTEVRPLVCRLFPFDYNEHGVKQEPAQGCPLELLEPGRDLIEVLGMRLEDARRWHRQLYEEIRTEKAAQCELV